MKMAASCYSCILDRAKFECDILFPDDDSKKGAMEELVDFMALHKGMVPSVVGTEREEIMKRRSKNPDPYLEMKAESNRVATALLPLAKKFYDESEDKLEALIRIAAAANSMEWGVKGHDFDVDSFEDVFFDTLNEKFDGDLEEARRRINRFEKILYLTDNAGEVVFDLFVIERLLEMGKRVVICPKTVPILNDVTADELRPMTPLPMEPSGPVIGLSLENVRPELLRLLRDESYLVIAKGMGNFETMTEFDEFLSGRLIYVMRAKCEPVSMTVGVPQGTLVVRAV
ncbi:MAG TPA: ARMT1-like domain-containing protein [Methanothrix sp.]|nr:ARMT1-like domain-containing protein [Methanothrix sp.]HPR67022.1 ARMT1-like domain-containing protein [Methanothrix sp.]